MCLENRRSLIIEVNSHVLRDCTSTFGPVNKVMVEPSKGEDDF